MARKSKSKKKRTAKKRNPSTKRRSAPKRRKRKSTTAVAAPRRVSRKRRVSRRRKSNPGTFKKKRRVSRRRRRNPGGTNWKDVAMGVGGAILGGVSVTLLNATVNRKGSTAILAGLTAGGLLGGGLLAAKHPALGIGVAAGAAGAAGIPLVSQKIGSKIPQPKGGEQIAGVERLQAVTADDMGVVQRMGNPFQRIGAVTADNMGAVTADNMGVVERLSGMGAVSPFRGSGAFGKR